MVARSSTSTGLRRRKTADAGRTEESLTKAVKYRMPTSGFVNETGSSCREGFEPAAVVVLA